MFPFLEDKDKLVVQFMYIPLIFPLPVNQHPYHIQRSLTFRTVGAVF